MTRIVIDTNIVVSAALSPTGNAAKIIALISNSEEVEVFYTTEIMNEYIRVLAYEKLNIAVELQNSMVGSLERFGILIEPPISTITMPDESDRTFYDAARASGATLITGNTRHYPDESFIVTAAEFLRQGNRSEVT